MPERPLILFPKRESAEKARRYGGSSSFHKPTHGRQIQRLTPQFNALQSALDNGRLQIQQEAEHIEPEYTLVLEVAGDPNAFDTAVRKLKKDHVGVEWLFELVDEDRAGIEDFYHIKEDGSADVEKSMTFKYFCVLTNQRALSDILSLWKNYQSDENYKFPIGKTGLRNVFQALVDIHIWGAKERLEETGILEAWQTDLQDPSLQNVYCEIELFFRSDSSKRVSAQNEIENAIRAVNGSIISQACIPEIEYHAILVKIPRDYAEQIITNQSVALVNLEQVMFFKPTGQSIVQTSHESMECLTQVNIPDEISNEPIIALFDGLPQGNHPLLDNLIAVDDPQNIASTYLVKEMLHGTSMASLILHGNLEAYSHTVNRKIYVRPIMRPYATSATETQEFLPDDVLIVDSIHQAVIRLFEDTAGQVAPSIRIINLSIGIGSRLFYNMISPLAKLLDWLSFKYRILFIISAGNHPDNVDLGIPYSEFNALSDDEKDMRIIHILNRDARKLKILSPAESMNALTVGALFQDSSNFTPNPRQMLPCANGNISLISSIGRGINRSIKPDIVFDGGRNVLFENYQNPNVANWRRMGNNPPGILSAKPISIQSGNPAVGYSFGTSDATAQISHNAAICYEILNEILNDEMDMSIPHEYAALLIKAMLAHGASWNKNADTIRSALSLSGRAADEVHRWIGYGYPDISRVKECAKNRITLIGYGELPQDKAHLYELPLPFDFHMGQIFRCLTVTLASFTPIRPTTQKYRSAQLWFTVDGIDKLRLNRIDASDKAVAKGTLQHERFAGDNVVVWGENDLVQVKVNCRADASRFEEFIPYALFCTFEIAPEVDIDVYQKIIDKVKVKEPVSPR